MCFTPWVSLTTAMLEFAIAILLFTYYRRSFFNRSAGILVLVLGLYQLSEFFLCTTLHPILWARIGFLAYTFLPALAVYFALRYSHHHPRIYLIFILPVFFSLLAIFRSDFVISASCQTFFTLVHTMLFPIKEHLFLSVLYFVVYYFGYVAVACMVTYNAYVRATDKFVKEEDWFIFLAGSTTLLGALVLLFVFPSIYDQWPSLYCQVSLFTAICAIIVAEIDRKRQKVIRRRRT